MSEIKDEDPVEQGLRTELILDGIFKFLPVRSLLCCSQVNKLWNHQARLYIRDHRKCTARMTDSPPCNRLKEIDEIVDGMAVVPFNSLHIFLGPDLECSAAGASAIFNYDNLKSKLRLKHLLILSFPGLETCPATFAVLCLLRNNASRIKSLRFQFLAPFLHNRLVQEQLNLPKLEVLELHGMHEIFWNTGGDLLQSMIGASSKLKRIVHDGDAKILKILPQDKYHLLTKFKCDDFVQSNFNGREDPCIKLARSGPALTDLEFHICRPDEQSTRASYEMLQLFLCSCRKFLERIRIYRICHLHSMMTFPPLETLQFLQLHSIVRSDRLMSMIQLIQFGRQFPKLQSIVLASFDPGNPLRIFSRSPQLEDETEVEVVTSSPHSSASTSVVQLDADVCHISFLQLKQVFPLVTKLYLNPTAGSAHAVPFRQIFRLWPHLKELRVRGQVTQELYNCDAEFCGIDQAEVECLWLMEEVELKNMVIVPKRPCPIVMPSLESIDIELSLIYNFDAMPHERPQKFLSVVTKCLLLQRVPGLNLHLKISPGDDMNNLIFDIND